MLQLIIFKKKNSFLKELPSIYYILTLSQKSLQWKFTKIRVGFERASFHLSFILACKSQAKLCFV